MSAVDKIIYDTLLRARNVYLPDVGTIYVEYKPAHRLSDTEFIPPRNVVSFTERRRTRSVSVTDKIASDGKIEISQAEELYNNWLWEARNHADGIRIEGVGTINADGRITADTEFYEILNPDRRVFVKIKRRHGIHTAVIAVCGFVLAFGVVFWSYGRYGDMLGAVLNKDAVEEKAVGGTAAGDTVEDSGAGNSFGQGADIDRQTVTQHDTAADAVNADTETEYAAMKRSETERTVSDAEQPCFYVIAGTFSVESNADKYIERLSREYASLDCEKIRLSQSRWMVSVGKASDRQRAQRLLSELGYVKSDMWIYSRRN